MNCEKGVLRDDYSWISRIQGQQAEPDAVEGAAIEAVYSFAW